MKFNERGHFNIWRHLRWVQLFFLLSFKCNYYARTIQWRNEVLQTCDVWLWRDEEFQISNGSFVGHMDENMKSRINYFHIFRWNASELNSIKLLAADIPSLHWKKSIMNIFLQFDWEQGKISIQMLFHYKKNWRLDLDLNPGYDIE